MSIRTSLTGVFAAAALTLVLPAAASAATTFTVDPASATTTCSVATSDLTCSSIASALAASSDGDTINLLAGEYDLTADLQISTAVSIVGQGSVTIKSAASTTWDTSNNGKHLIDVLAGTTTTPFSLSNVTLDSNNESYGVQFYNAIGSLQNVTIKNSKGAALTVNGSTVSASNLSASGDSWGSVNVDPGSGVTNPSVFTLSSGTLGDATQIWSDGGHVNATSTVTVNASGYTKYLAAGTTAFYVWANTTPKGATIAGDASNTLYSTISAAVASSTSGATINVGPGTYNETVSITQPLTLKGAQAGIAGNSHSGSESIVSGMAITANNVTVDGFKFNGPDIQMNLNQPGSTIASGIVVENNIFSGYGNPDGVGIPTYDAGNVIIQKNLFENPQTNTEAIQIKASAVAGGCNGTQVLNNVFNAATNNGAADVNFSCTTSTSTNITISGNNESGNTGGTSFTALSGIAGGISITNNVVSGSTGSALLFFGDVSGTATISGNTITGGASNAISIHGGDDFAGVNDPVNTGTFTITNNDLSGNAKSINIASGALTGSLMAHKNKLSGNTTAALNHDSSVSVDATSNYWGSTSAPTVSSTTSAEITGAGAANVSYAPWYTDSAMTTLKNPTTTTTDGNQQATVSSATTVSGTSGGTTISAAIPAGTTVTGTSTWDGVIQAPTVTTVDTSVIPHSTGNNVTTVALAIQVGSPSVSLQLSKAAQLTFPGMAGKSVGWTLGSTFTPITTACADNTQATNDANLGAGEDCKIDSGSDLVVWTKHFTTFAVYSESNVTGGGSFLAAAPSSSGSEVPVATTTTPGATSTPASTNPGEVLGAAAYNFAADLFVGKKSADVSALQQFLASGGYFKASVSGYFGPLTKAAVIAFQKANKLPQTGYVGKLTRALLNKGEVSTTPEVSGTTLTAAQVSAIVSLMQSFGVDQATIAKVEASL